MMADQIASSEKQRDTPMEMPQMETQQQKEVAPSIALETQSDKPNEGKQQYMDIEDKKLDVENQSAL